MRKNDCLKILIKTGNALSSLLIDKSFDDTILRSPSTWFSFPNRSRAGRPANLLSKRATTDYLSVVISIAIENQTT